MKYDIIFSNGGMGKYQFHLDPRFNKLFSSFIEDYEHNGEKLKGIDTLCKNKHSNQTSIHVKLSLCHSEVAVQLVKILHDILIWEELEHCSKQSLLGVLSEYEDLNSAIKKTTVEVVSEYVRMYQNT